jgi:hypothetical protein
MARDQLCAEARHQTVLRVALAPKCREVGHLWLRSDRGSSMAARFQGLLQVPRGRGAVSHGATCGNDSCVRLSTSNPLTDRELFRRAARHCGPFCCWPSMRRLAHYGPSAGTSRTCPLRQRPLGGKRPELGARSLEGSAQSCRHAAAARVRHARRARAGLGVPQFDHRHSLAVTPCDRVLCI